MLTGLNTEGTPLSGAGNTPTTFSDGVIKVYERSSLESSVT